MERLELLHSVLSHALSTTIQVTQPVDHLVFFLCNLESLGIKSLCRTLPTSHAKDQWASPAM